MISDNMLTQLNNQIQREFYSSYLYLAMSNYCSSKSLIGFAKWLRAQADEERGHGLKLIDYVEAQQRPVTLQALGKPASEFKSVHELFETVLEHERSITGAIHDLFALAQSEKDFATQTFLGWFITEQVEEEASAQLVVDKLKMIGASAGSLLYLDKELGKRAAEKAA